MSQRRHYPAPLPIRDAMTEERLSKAKGIIYKRQRVLQDKLTTNDYEDSLIFDARLYKNKMAQIINKATANALKYQILACIDPEKWETIKTETEIVAGSSDHFPTTETEEVESRKAWSYVKVQVKSSLADTPAKTSAYISGSTP